MLMADIRCQRVGGEREEERMTPRFSVQAAGKMELSASVMRKKKCL